MGLGLDPTGAMKTTMSFISTTALPTPMPMVLPSAPQVQQHMPTSIGNVPALPVSKPIAAVAEPAPVEKPKLQMSAPPPPPAPPAVVAPPAPAPAPAPVKVAPVPAPVKVAPAPVPAASAGLPGVD